MSFGYKVYLGFVVWPVSKSMQRCSAKFLRFLTAAACPQLFTAAYDFQVPEMYLTFLGIRFEASGNSIWIRELTSTIGIRHAGIWINCSSVYAQFLNVYISNTFMRSDDTSFRVPCASATSPAFWPKTLCATEFPSAWMMPTASLEIFTIDENFVATPPVSAPHFLIWLVRDNRGFGLFGRRFWSAVGSSNYISVFRLQLLPLLLMSR